MDNPVFRAIAIYLFLLILFRFMGKRSLSQATTFDLVLLLIISEATQEAMIGEDYSLTQAYIVIATLVGVDIVLNLVKNRWNWFEKVTESMPLLLLSDGKVLTDRLMQTNVKEEDLLESARRQHGFASLQPVRYAVLEIDGTITIIPRETRRGHSAENNKQEAK